MLNQDEKEFLLNLAKRSVEYFLVNRAPLPISSADISEQWGEETALLKSLGAFVTLEIDGKLRGCIGNLFAQGFLFEYIILNAIAAGFKDPRFPPMRKDELNCLAYEISILGAMEKVTDLHTIQIGKHGLLVKNNLHQGILLPQVALERKWDIDTFLKQTCLKAGLASDAHKHPETEIYYFSAEIIN